MSPLRFPGRRNRISARKGRAISARRLQIESLETRALVTADLLSTSPLAASSSDNETIVPLAISMPQTSNSAAQTVVPAAATVTPIAQEFITITDSKDNPLTGPLAIGQTFWVDFSVADLRTTLSDAGIIEAHTNIAFDSSLVTPTGNFANGPNYTFGVTNKVMSPGLIQLGALETFNVSATPPFAPLGSGVQLVGRAEFTVSGSGPITFTDQFPTDLGGQNLLVGDVAGTQDTAGAGEGTVGSLMDSEVNLANPVTIPSVSIAGGSATTGAAATSINFTVTASSASSQPLTLDYSTQPQAGDTAVSGTDFTGTTTGTVTIPANQTTATIQIPVAANAQPQPAKTFHVALSVDAASTQVATINPAAASAAGKINFPAPTVSVQNSSVTETSSTATTMSFQVSLNGTSSQPITVQYKAESLAGDTGVGGTNINAPGVDYYSADSTTNDPQAPPLVIAAGNTSGTITIPIAAEQAGADKTFHLVLTGATNASLSASPQAAGTIINSVNTPAASIAPASVTNGLSGTTTNMNFTVSLSQAATAPIVLDYQTQSSSGDTAVAGTDFGTNGSTAQVTGQVTIPAGQTTGQFSIPIIGSSTFEPDKTFHVSLSADPSSARVIVNPNTSAVGTIHTGAAQPTATIADATVNETTPAATTMNFIVTLAAISGEDTTITYNTVSQTGDTAVGGSNVTVPGVDYQSITGGTLTIPAGQTQGTIAVPIGAELAGPSATFHVVMTDATGGGALGATTSALGTITNSIAVPSASIQSVATIAEPSTGFQNLSLSVTLSAASRVPVVLDYATTGQTAVAGTDYGTSGVPSELSGTVTIPALATTGTITIPILANSSLSQDATFQVTISAQAGGASNASIASGGSQSTDTIAFMPVFAGIADSSVTETSPTATTMTFTVSLLDANNQSTTSNKAVTINYQTINQSGDTAVGGATVSTTASTTGTDYQSVTNGTLTIAAGQSTGTISIPIGAELANSPDKTFHIQLLNSTVNAALATDATAVGTIHQAIATPTASIAATTAATGPTGGTLSLPVTLSAASAVPITIDYTTQTLNGDTALSGIDFGNQGTVTPVTGQVTIPAGQTTGTITLPLLEKTLFSQPLNFHFAITADANSTNLVSIPSAGASALATITNSNAAPTVNIANASVTETSTNLTTMDFTVSLVDANNAAAVSGQDVTITFSTATQPASGGQPADNAVGGSDASLLGVDYQSFTNATVTIPAGQSSSTIHIPIGAELAGAPIKTFHVNISNVSGAAVAGTTTSALGTITDNVPAPTATIQNASLTVPTTDQQNMSFTINLSAPSAGAVSINYTTQDGTAVAGSDYVANTNGVVVLQPGQTSATISVGVLPDANLSADRSFSVAITSANNASPSGIAATGTIQPAVGNFSGSLFVDTNNDGVRESGEHGVGGILMTLTGTTTSGQPVTVQAPTAGDGSFNFPNLLPGTYTVTNSNLSQYIASPAQPGAGVTAIGNNSFSFTMTAGANLSGSAFVERGLEPQLISKRMFLSSAIH